MEAARTLQRGSQLLHPLFLARNGNAGSAASFFVRCRKAAGPRGPRGYGKKNSMRVKSSDAVAGSLAVCLLDAENCRVPFDRTAASTPLRAGLGGCPHR